MPSEARNRTVEDWMTRIRTHQIVLPRFQRFEAWGHSQVSQLFNTILQDLPCGVVLTLDIGDEEPFVARPIAGAPTEGEKVNEHLLDGQQRITAIWRGLKNDYPDRTYFLNFQRDEETEMLYYVDSVSRFNRSGGQRRFPLWADDPRQQWERRMIPLNLFAPGDETTGKYRDWARSAIEDRDEREDVADCSHDVRRKISGFNLPFLFLPVHTQPEIALQVFVRMNTSATPLSAYDIVVAQVEAQHGVSLHDLVAHVREICPAIAKYYQIEALVLYASALLQRREPSNSTYMSREFVIHLIENWETLLKGIHRTAEFLLEERIFDSDRLPTDVVVPVLTALWAEAAEGLDAEGYARSILRKYLWRASFSSRYERSTATRSLVDYNELTNHLHSGSKDFCPTIFNDIEHPLPEESEFIEAGWPRKKDRLARAILSTSLKKGGLDLADGSAATQENLSRREYHHLFPVAHLRHQCPSLPDSRIYSALNCALVTWRTNRAISDKEPERYLTDRRAKFDPGDEEIRQRLESHLIPYDEMISGNYEVFLQKRAEMIHAAMQDLCD